MHPANDNVVATYDRFAAAYDRLVSPFQTSTRKEALALLDMAEAERVVEVGCGPGHGLIELGRRVGPRGRVLGIDAAWEMVRRARRRLRGRGAVDGSGLDRFEVVLGDARDLPLRSASVDVVFMEDTLELFSRVEIDQVVGELRRILRAQGQLCLVTMERGLSERSAFIRIYDWIFEHFRPFRTFGCRPIEARQSLRRGGFRVEQVARTRRAFIWPVEIILARPGGVEP